MFEFSLENNSYTRDDDGHVITDIGRSLNFKFEKARADYMNVKTDYELFFEYIENARIKGEKYWFSERQYVGAEFTKSGIRIDIDAYQTGEERKIRGGDIDYLVRKFAKVLNANLDFEDTEYVTYIVVMMKAVPVQCDEGFKEGIHILAPGIMVAKVPKTYIIGEYASTVCGTLGDMGFTNPKQAIDEHSANVPVEIYGTRRQDRKESYAIRDIYEVILRSGQKCKVRALPAEDYANHNMCLELSIHYAGKLIPMREFTLKKEKIQNTIVQNYNFPYKKTPEEVAKDDVKYLVESDYLADEVYKFVKILDRNRGVSGQYKAWRTVIQIIAGINLDYKPIAIIWSMACDLECWQRGGLEALNKIWCEVEDSLRDTVNIEAKKTSSYCQLKNIAKIDNYEAYDKIKKTSLQDTLIKMCKQERTLTQNAIANLVKLILKDTLKYVPFPRKGYRNAGYWIEYVTGRNKENKKMDIYIYKYYRHEMSPTIIDKTITEHLTGALNSIANYFLRCVKDEPNKEEQKMFRHWISIIDRAINMCGTHNTIENIKARCQQSAFIDYNIRAQLDNYPNVMGVGNGILVFGEKAQFINRHCDYLLSRTTQTFYRPYDPQNIHIQRVEKILEDIMPDVTKRRTMLMHFAQCFVKNLCSRYFNILFSPGGSGKSILMALIGNALGFMDDKRYANCVYGYFNSVTPDVFVREKKDINGADHSISQMENALFIACEEGGKGSILCNVVKQVRSGIKARAIYEENRKIDFGGIITYLTNNTPPFQDYNYAIERRFLYIEFPSKFTEEPTLEHHRKMDKGLENEANNSLELGEAMLSILVHHYDLMRQCKMEEEYRKCGFHDDTVRYMSSKNFIAQFAKKHIREDEEQNMKIKDFCRIYVTWLKDEQNLSYRPKPDTCKPEAMSYFDGKKKIIDGEEYFTGIVFHECDDYL